MDKTERKTLMTKEKRFCLGKIVGVHGIKGEVKVASFTEPDTNIDKYGIVEDQTGTKHFEIKVTGHSKELLRIKIKGIDDRTSAEALKGTEFYVSREVMPKLSEDSFYLEDLVGMKVILAENKAEVGKVCGVYNFGAGDILEIKISEGGQREMIPFTKAYVPEVNIDEGYIIVESVLMNYIDDDESLSDEG